VFLVCKSSHYENVMSDLLSREFRIKEISYVTFYMFLLNLRWFFNVKCRLHCTLLQTSRAKLDLIATSYWMVMQKKASGSWSMKQHPRAQSWHHQWAFFWYNFLILCMFCRGMVLFLIKFCDSHCYKFKLIIHHISASNKQVAISWVLCKTCIFCFS
jgi:hypothetical protein